jgi:hypothetical protein
MDLIMERTRGMSLSSEEKEIYRKEELEKKAKGFRLKLLEDATRADQLLASIEAEPEENRNLLRSMIWKSMVEGLMDDENPIKYLDLLEKLPQAREKRSVLKEARAALNAAMKDKSKDRKKVLIREKKKLASFGISGSAVVPKMPKRTGSGSEFGETVERFRKKLLENIRAA